MAVIHKFPIAFDSGIAQLPRRAEVLHIGEQHGTLFVWALVDPNEPPTVEHEYLIFGTGQPVPDNAEGLTHRVTVAMPGGLVWHIFEEVSF